MEGVAARIREVGASQVLCVLSTTSCFAPRGVDKLLELGRLCAELGVPHVANNAYGVQCAQCMKAITSASRHGRLDAFIQSTDKNFLVPVGGAILASCSAEFGKLPIAKTSRRPLTVHLILILSPCHPIILVTPSLALTLILPSTPPPPPPSPSPSLSSRQVSH